MNEELHPWQRYESMKELPKTPWHAVEQKREKMGVAVRFAELLASVADSIPSQAEVDEIIAHERSLNKNRDVI